MSTIKAIRGSTRVRGAKLIFGAATLYLVLRLAGFHKLFENDAEGHWRSDPSHWLGRVSGAFADKSAGQMLSFGEVRP